MILNEHVDNLLRQFDHHKSSSPMVLGQRYAKILNIKQLKNITVITVAGTNGKGSCVKFLEKLYTDNNYKVGTFSSPHLHAWNERICINMQAVSHQILFDILTTVKIQSLSIFESLLACALLLFIDAQVDIILLEVGLGGLYDATNVIDANVSIVTGVDYDHQHILGHTLDEIGKQKAGIFRSGRPAIYGSKPMLKSVQQYADDISANLIYCGQHFKTFLDETTWSFEYQNLVLDNMILSTLPVPSIASGLVAVKTLESPHPIDRSTIHSIINTVQIPGRIERFLLPNDVHVIMDVSHNRQSLMRLHDYIKNNFEHTQMKIRMLFRIKASKTVLDTILKLNALVDEWVIPTNLINQNFDANNKMLSIEEFIQLIKANSTTRYTVVDNSQTAWQYSCSSSQKNDLIVVCGSFQLVGECREICLHENIY